MKTKFYLIITALIISLTSCEKEEVAPSNARMSNEGTLIIDCKTPVVVSVVYLTAERLAGEKILKDTIVQAGRHEFAFTVSKNIDFAYGIQKRSYQDVSEYSATMIFRDFSRTLVYSKSDVLADIYEFPK